jgi:UDPglucose 6-dehydrogenase
MLCSAIGKATRNIVRARLSPFFPSPEDISINPAVTYSIATYLSVICMSGCGFRQVPKSHGSFREQIPEIAELHEGNRRVVLRQTTLDIYHIGNAENHLYSVLCLNNNPCVRKSQSAGILCVSLALSAVPDIIEEGKNRKLTADAKEERKMNISVIGIGYVGLVQSVVLAEFGMNVVCMDVDAERIERLQHGDIPIYEPGLSDLLQKNLPTGRLTFTTDMRSAAEHGDVIFIAVGTPALADGGADLRYVLDAAEKIGQYMIGNKVVAIKSTVPVGTGRKVRQIIRSKSESRNAAWACDVVSNPEFLREGKAVRDCLLPDRIVIGANSEKAVAVMKKVYDVLYLNQTPFLVTDIESAEMIKYASNAFLAVKVSFINEMALLADKVGADIQDIARGMGMDGRISPKFLHAGPGYGGSCFPKDTKSIIDIAHRHGEDLLVIEAAAKANEKQKQKAAERILQVMGEEKEISDCRIAVWGLSFKPDTDDVRDAPSLDIMRSLIKEGVHLQVFCPQGMRETKAQMHDCQDAVVFCKDEYAAAKDADALVLVTEWHQFRGADLARIRECMRGDAFFDLRNVFSKNTSVRELFRYYGMGCR